MKLIDKDAVVVKIKHHIKEETHSYFCKCLLSEIDTLEVKEVDLENEINDWYNTMGIPVTTDALKETACHFFELGLKVNQKGE